MVTLGLGLFANVFDRFPLPGNDRTKLMMLSICADCVIGLALALAIIIAA
tara:strand:+ start:24517 stop:24666 length:150 start_codon:yes stop_codon:yes gene_type:complete